MNAAERCRRACCSHYYVQQPLTLEMVYQHGFLEDGETYWLPDVMRTPMSESRREHVANRATDPAVFVSRDDDWLIFFTHQVDELAGVAVARIRWEPLAVELDVETTATGGARIVVGR